MIRKHGFYVCLSCDSELNWKSASETGGVQDLEGGCLFDGVLCSLCPVVDGMQAGRKIYKK